MKVTSIIKVSCGCLQDLNDFSIFKHNMTGNSFVVVVVKTRLTFLNIGFTDVKYICLVI